MDESDPGKRGIEELVQGYAAGLGIDRTRLRFRWQKKPPVQGLRLQQQILALTISLGKNSTVISFSEELVRNSTSGASAFVSKYTDHVMIALGRLVGPNKRTGISPG